MLEVNKKQVPLRSYSLKIRIDSANQILKNKDKITQTLKINILTRIISRKIPCVYLCLSNNEKCKRPGPYNFLRHTDYRKYFSGLSRTRN